MTAATSSELFLAKLKEAGFSITTPRKVVYGVLSENEALSMGQLIELVKDDIDRTSVYRAIELFEKLGIVHRVHIGWKYKVELSEQYSHHHHHISCVQCNAVDTYEESPELEADIHALAQKLGYQLDSHTLELRGLCKDCRPPAKVLVWPPNTPFL